MNPYTKFAAFAPAALRVELLFFCPEESCPVVYLITFSFTYNVRRGYVPTHLAQSSGNVRFHIIMSYGLPSL